METILCNSIVAEDGVVGMDRRITNFADVRIAVSACAVRYGLVTIDVDVYACRVDVSRVRRSRRMLRKSRLVLGSASLVRFVMRPCGATIPDGHDGDIES